MSTATLTPALTAPAGSAKARGLRALLTPSFTDCLFIALVVWLFLSGPAGWTWLLADGDSGWHIRTGEQILATGTVPKLDPFSFTKQGQPWFAWEWGADVIYALLHQAGGLKALVLFAGVLIVSYCIILFRYMLWGGTNLLLALAVALLTTGASSIHFLARPHLFTLVLVPVSVWIIQRDRQNPGKLIWALAPLTGVWTNLHGGFLALIAMLGMLTAGTALEGGGWGKVIRYLKLTAACVAASLLNPYGWQLHVHIASYLRSDWIRDVVMEFQSPKFRNENVLQFELLLFAGLVTCWSLLSRRRITEALWILFWAHQALGAVRHITVFSAVAAPILALELSRLWDQWVAPAGKASVRKILDAMSGDVRPKFAWNSLWPLVFVASLWWMDRVVWPADYPEEKFPVATVARHKHRIQAARIFTTDQWADYLIYRHYPVQRVFFDGRSDFYGQELGREYVELMHGHWRWRQLLDKHQLEMVLLPPEMGLSTLLKEDAGWAMVEDGGKALLFERVKPVTAANGEAGGKNIYPGLMETSQPSEFSKGELIEMKAGRRIQEASGVSRKKRDSMTKPVEQVWSLPSGTPLGVFALRSGFAAPGLMSKSAAMMHARPGAVGMATPGSLGNGSGLFLNKEMRDRVRAFAGGNEHSAQGWPVVDGGNE
ncbi:MAG: hypothetical protein FJW20_11165 [Acidimicrobiia bacterium]|nr:hypothetical protein [Acidimicrobiia bacterium]